MPADDAASATRAFAGGDLQAAQPKVKHFMLLDDAADFLRARDGPCRAVGFFSDRLDAPEHTVFLTVAKRVSETESHPLAVKLARSTVGRGTSGASVFLVPRASAIMANGSTVAAAVLTYQYRVPESPSDTSLPEQWRRLVADRAASPSPPLPPPPAMWHEVLEAEATRLDRFLRRGAIPDVSELTKETLATLAASAHTLGLLLWPDPEISTVSDSMRGYHMRRLRQSVAKHVPILCHGDDAAPQAAADDEWGTPRPWTTWLTDHADCTTLPAKKAVRFAHAYSNMSLMAAFFDAKVDLEPEAALWRAPSREVRFAVLRRRRGPRAADEGRSKWQAHLLKGAVTAEAVASFLGQHTVQRTNASPEPRAEAAVHGDEL